MTTYAEKMTPALAQKLAADGYLLPDTWPANARVCTQFASRAGWAVRTIGAGREEGATVYVAPDRSQWTRATHGARVTLVCLSKKLCASLMRTLPGTKRPTWVITDAPKGEVPEHLRRFLLKPGQKLNKGEKREVEALLVEPEGHSRTTTGRAGSAVAVLGPRPKPGTLERTEWNRKYRALRADHFKQYRDNRKTGHSPRRATARA